MPVLNAKSSPNTMERVHLTCPIFYAHSHLRASYNGQENFSSNFGMILFLNNIVNNLLFELCNGLMLTKINPQLWYKCVPVFCHFFCITTKSLSPIFTSQNSYQILRVFLYRPLSNKVVIKNIFMISSKIFNICF